ncbi:hypothetical protein [Brevundimonas sp.]|uniref:hypothetical protein n=1 Tax=Brevundimonas sp. TaxID=1871086 RepID=UPI0025FCFE95|nr:hypothetical protein [Brevundimonas sp.]
MRKILLVLAATAPLALAACATTGMDRQSYQEEFQALNAECQARGGMLTPIPGSTGPRPANDYACEIRGGGSGRIG